MSEDRPTWKIIFHRNAEKALDRLPITELNRVWARIKELENDPRPYGCKKLKGTACDNLYRLRVGDWRILYAIEEEKLIILILDIEPRGSAYRQL